MAVWENTNTTTHGGLNKKMNYIRKIKKNAKALSPVVASIILIAVTVAVSVVVAAWMGGMTIGLMGNAEQVSVSNAQFTTDSSVTLTVRNTGGATVTISSATVDGKNTVTLNPVAPLNVGKGNSTDVSITLTSGTFNPGSQYEIKLITAKGTTVVYTATYNPIS
jgi:archaeal type IV pilus assembly protein PilA